MRTPLSLRSRALLLVAFTFATVFALLGGYAYRDIGARIETAKREFQNSANLLAARQDDIVVDIRLLLGMLAEANEVRGFAKGEGCSQFLAARMSERPYLGNLTVARTDGEVVCSATPMPGPVNVADRQYFQAALKKRGFVIGEALVGRVTGKPGLAFGQPLLDARGEAQGVLIASLELSWLRDALSRAGHPEGSHLVLMDGAGTILVRHPDPEGWTGRVVSDTPLYKAARGRGGTFEETGLDGKRRLYAITRFAQTETGPLLLWLSLPKEAVTGPAVREAAWTAAIVLALLVLVLVTVVVDGRRYFLRPMLRLYEAARRFGAGDHSVRTGLPHGADELGQLARMLDEVAEAVETGERRLLHANRALRVLSAGNRTLLRAQEEQKLLADMCRQVVEAGGYRMAWVGYAEHDPEKSIRPMAHWGVDQAFFDALKLSWDEGELNQSATARAIRQGVPVIVRNVESDPAVAPWREFSRRYGIASAVALPLRIGQEPAGALVICAAEPDAFGDEEAQLLEETAADLAYGIHTLRGAAALKRAEERYRAAAQASIDALFILNCMRDAAGAVTDFELAEVNAVGETMLRLPHEAIIGRRLCELIPLCRSGGFFDKYAAVVNTGEPLDEEFPVDTPQIGAKWLRQQVVRLGDGVAISLRDITAWKEMAAEAGRQDRLRKLILESASEGIFGVDCEGRCTFINRAAAAMLQWAEAEVAGRDVHPLHHHTKADGTPYPAAECRILASCWDGETHIGADEIYWRRDGSSFPVEFMSSPMRNDRGELVGAVVSFRDISERKAAERALARANRALKTLSAGNEELVRATDEAALLQAVCRILVDTGGYRMTWVGYADDNPEKTVSAQAWAGTEEGYLAGLNLTWAAGERGQSPAGRTIRSGLPELARDIPADPQFAPWRIEAQKRGYASSLAIPLLDGARAFGALSIYSAEPDAFSEEEIGLLTELGNDLAFGIVSLRTRAERDRIAYQHVHHAEILQKSLEQSIAAIADTVEARDPYTAGHQRRVGELAVAIAREMRLPDEKIHGIRLAATIHDLGKIQVPAEILAKPGRLTKVEFMLIQAHPQAGYDILKGVDFPWPIADIVLQHHEKLDGSGYPQGLKDGQILLESRIMTVADVVEAMSSHRPYRAALGIEAALAEIERGRGGAYDPAVADACLKLFRDGRFAFSA